jgi:hypothetical protein
MPTVAQCAKKLWKGIKARECSEAKRHKQHLMTANHSAIRTG